MQTTLIMLVGFAILAHALTRAQKQREPAWSQHLKGSQKLFGVVALVVAMLIILNPEFLALGLLGDTAFFDMFVLALSLQMHMVVARACRACVTVLIRRVWWIGIPSPGLRYLLAVSALAIGNAATIVRKASRIFSSHAMA